MQEPGGHLASFPGALIIDPTEPAQYVALSHEISALLLDLSIGVHHCAMYPRNHPAQQPAVDAIMARLGGIFIERRAFTVGAADRQLVVDGAATDPNHPALSELARRIHGHQLGAIVFNRGVKATEVREVLLTLAQEVDISGTPVGLLPPDDFPTWENARLFRIGYEDLELRDGGGGGTGPEGVDRATALWLGLAHMAMPEDLRTEYGPDGQSLADQVRSKGDRELREQIAEYVRHIAYELKGARGAAAEEIRRRFSDFMNRIDAETMERIVDSGGSFSRRQRFLLDANQSLSADAVLKILQAAASQTEQGISHSMTRLLGKLSVHAEQGSSGVRALADTALRDNVEALLHGWELKDPNPESYTLELDSLARAAPIFDASESSDDLTGSLRLIQMAIEVDADGEMIENAVPAFIAGYGVGPLIELLEQAPADNKLSAKIRSSITKPSRFRQLLSDERFDPGSLRAVAARMGPAALEPMLDVMEVSESRAVRRMIFDLLAEMGPSVAERVAQRLEGAPWFVLRNNLALLNRFGELPEGFDPWPYAAHDDVRVRRAALPLVMRVPSRRDEALRRGLAEEDAFMVRMALHEMQSGMPEDLPQQLVDRVVLSPWRADEIRALGARVLAGTGTPLARTTLLKVTVSGKTILGQPKIASRSLLVLAALRSLAQGWPDDPAVRAVVRRAGRSKDAEIAAAVQDLDMEKDGEETPEQPE